MTYEEELLAMYQGEIKAVAFIIAGINPGDLRAIFVEVTILTGVRDLEGATVREESKAIIEAIRAADPRHSQFILGAAIIRNRLPEL